MSGFNPGHRKADLWTDKLPPPSPALRPHSAWAEMRQNEKESGAGVTPDAVRVVSPLSFSCLCSQMCLCEQFMGSRMWEVTELRLSLAYSSAKLSGISQKKKKVPCQIPPAHLAGSIGGKGILQPSVLPSTRGIVNPGSRHRQRSHPSELQFVSVPFHLDDYGARGRTD